MRLYPQLPGCSFHGGRFLYRSESTQKILTILTLPRPSKVVHVICPYHQALTQSDWLLVTPYGFSRPKSPRGCSGECFDDPYDGQKQSDDNKADNNRQKYDHNRLNNRGDSVHRIIHVFIVVIGNSG